MTISSTTYSTPRLYVRVARAIGSSLSGIGSVINSALSKFSTWGSGTTSKKRETAVKISRPEASRISTSPKSRLSTKQNNQTKAASLVSKPTKKHSSVRTGVMKANLSLSPSIKDETYRYKTSPNGKQLINNRTASQDTANLTAA